MPEEAREDTIDLCVHNMHRAPKQPERLFMQFHGGVYRSDDAGETWISIADGLPSDFGFPMVIDPDDPDSAYVIPLVADLDRTTPEGKVRVYETRDAGATLDRARRRPPAGRRVPHDPAPGVLRRGLGIVDGALLRRDVGRRLRLARRRQDVVHRGDEAAAGALGARGVGRTRSSRGRPRASPMPRDSMKVGEMRTDTRVSPSRCDM